jgi:hypothetical protein
MQDIQYSEYDVKPGQSFYYKMEEPLPSWTTHTYFKYDIIDVLPGKMEESPRNSMTFTCTKVYGEFFYWNEFKAEWRPDPAMTQIIGASNNQTLLFGDMAQGGNFNIIFPVRATAQTINESLPQLGLMFGDAMIVSDDLTEFSVDANWVEYSEPQWLKINITLDLERHCTTKFIFNMTDGEGGAFLAFNEIDPFDLPNNTMPIADFDISINGLQVFLNSTSQSNNSIVSYTWDFGDGETGSGASIQHTYAQSGTYNLTLIVEDSNGDISIKTMQIKVSSFPSWAWWVIGVGGGSLIGVAVYLIIRYRKK